MGEEKEISIHVDLPLTVQSESVINLMPPPHIKPTTYEHRHLLNGCGGGGGRGSGEVRLEEIVLKQESYCSPLQPPPGFTAPPFPSSSFCTVSPKRRRGRPLGSRNRPKVPPTGQLFGRIDGDGFTPYLVTIQTGQDVLTALSSFHFGGAQGVCVLSATGTVSSVTMRTYGIMSSTSEGLFEIISLTGFFVTNDPTRLLDGSGLTIAISDFCGRVRGGAVSGPIVAASPIQVVLGSFTPKSPSKPQKRKYTKRIPTPTGTMGRPSGGFVSLLQSQHTWAGSTTVGVEMKSGSPVGPLDEISCDDAAMKTARNIQNLNLEPSGDEHGEGKGSGSDLSQYSSPADGQTFISSSLEELFGV